MSTIDTSVDTSLEYDVPSDWTSSDVVKSPASSVIGFWVSTTATRSTLRSQTSTNDRASLLFALLAFPWATILSALALTYSISLGMREYWWSACIWAFCAFVFAIGAAAQFSASRLSKRLMR